MRRNPKQGEVQLGNCSQLWQSMDLSQTPTNLATQQYAEIGTLIQLACVARTGHQSYVALMNIWRGTVLNMVVSMSIG